jgi:hypothetical protein
LLSDWRVETKTGPFSHKCHKRERAKKGGEKQKPKTVGELAARGHLVILMASFSSHSNNVTVIWV